MHETRRLNYIEVQHSGQKPERYLSFPHASMVLGALAATLSSGESLSCRITVAFHAEQDALGLLVARHYQLDPTLTAEHAGYYDVEMRVDRLERHPGGVTSRPSARWGTIAVPFAD